MKNTLKTILAALSLTIVLASCTPKTDKAAGDAEAPDTTTVVEPDTTAQPIPGDTTAN